MSRGIRVVPTATCVLAASRGFLIKRSELGPKRWGGYRGRRRAACPRGRICAVVAAGCGVVGRSAAREQVLPDHDPVSVRIAQFQQRDHAGPAAHLGQVGEPAGEPAALGLDVGDAEADL